MDGYDGELWTLYCRSTVKEKRQTFEKTTLNRKQENKNTKQRQMFFVFPYMFCMRKNTWEKILRNKYLCLHKPPDFLHCQVMFLMSAWSAIFHAGVFGVKLWAGRSLHSYSVTLNK